MVTVGDTEDGWTCLLRVQAGDSAQQRSAQEEVDIVWTVRERQDGFFGAVCGVTKEYAGLQEGEEDGGKYLLLSAALCWPVGRGVDECHRQSGSRAA